jgi:hypothetical protein
MRSPADPAATLLMTWSLPALPTWRSKQCDRLHDISKSVLTPTRLEASLRLSSEDPVLLWSSYSLCHLYFYEEAFSSTCTSECLVTTRCILGGMGRYVVDNVGSRATLNPILTMPQSYRLPSILPSAACKLTPQRTHNLVICI